MKILFIIDSLRSGGKERRLVSLIEGLNEIEKIEMEIIISSKNIHYKSIIDTGIKIHFLERNSIKDFRLLSKFNIIINNLKPDIVHCWDNIAAIHFGPICKIKKIPFINSMITAAPDIQKLSKRYIINAISYPFSDVILSNSQAGLDNLFVPKKKQKVIHNGFNFDRLNNLIDKEFVYDKFNIDKSKSIIGMVASFTNHKDYETFIKAGLELLKSRDDFQLIAIGDGPNLKAIKNNIDKNILKHFIFLGKITDIESIVNTFDIAVLSTYTEGISNAIMEYMALSKPVIATDGGGTKELVVDNETGFLIEEKNEVQLAEKMSLLLENPNVSKEMGKKGKERIQKYFSIDKMVNETYELYFNKIKNKV